MFFLLALDILWNNFLYLIQKQPFTDNLQNMYSWQSWRVYRKKSVLDSFFNKAAELQDCNFKKRFQYRCFPVNFTKFLRTLFFTEHLWETASVLQYMFNFLIRNWAFGSLIGLLWNGLESTRKASYFSGNVGFITILLCFPGIYFSIKQTYTNLI